MSKKTNLSEQEIDRIVISQANDDSAWGSPARVRKTRRASLSIPPDLAARAAHNEFRRKLAEIKAWVSHEGISMVEVIALQVTLEEWLVNHICTIDVQLRGTDTRG